MDFIKNYIKGGIHMKYVVYSRFKTEVPYSKTICDNEETLATTIQYLRIDLVTSSVHENVEIRVFPYFEEGQMVLNIKTLQTRIVKAVMALEKGKLVVYDNDCPDEAELQEQGYVSIIPEEWNIRDCVPVNSKEARKEGFQFGTEMGVHPKYSEMQAREMGM